MTRKPRATNVVTEVVDTERVQGAPLPSFCAIPPHFFDNAADVPESIERELFTIHSWDGRPVLKVDARSRE